MRKVARVRLRLPGQRDIEGLIRATDRQRVGYIRTYFHCHWMGPRLYHLMVSSGLGDDVVESQIIEALASGG